jgi:hypothetical protein
MTIFTKPTEGNIPQVVQPEHFKAYPTGQPVEISEGTVFDRYVSLREAYDSLAKMPSSHNGLIMWRGKNHELIVNDDPNFVSAFEAVDGHEHKGVKRSIGAKAVDNIKKAIRHTDTEGEIVSAIEQFTKVRSDTLCIDPGEFTVAIPHISMKFAESFPGAELTPEEIYVLLETGVGCRQKQQSGEPGIEVDFALAIENVLNNCGENVLQLWHALKPYFKEFPSLIAEINKVGALAGCDILGINEFMVERHGKEKSAFDARMALRALAINIAQTAFEYNMANAKDLL